MRISELFTFYLADCYDTHEGDEDIEFYRGGLKALDLANARLEIFSERYDIDLG